MLKAGDPVMLINIIRLLGNLPELLLGLLGRATTDIGADGRIRVDVSVSISELGDSMMTNGYQVRLQFNSPWIVGKGYSEDHLQFLKSKANEIAASIAKQLGVEVEKL